MLQKLLFHSSLHAHCLYFQCFQEVPKNTKIANQIIKKEGQCRLTAEKNLFSSCSCLERNKQKCQMSAKENLIIIEWPLCDLWFWVWNSCGECNSRNLFFCKHPCNCPSRKSNLRFLSNYLL